MSAAGIDAVPGMAGRAAATPDKARTAGVGTGRGGPAHRAIPVRRRRSVLARAAGGAVTVLLIAAALAFVALAIAPRIMGYQTLTMLTGSMSPLINPGDVVITAPTAAESIKVGDIITYHIPVEDHRVETHRVVDVARGPNGAITVQTKGDANNGKDPWVATLDRNVVDKQVATIPYAGSVIRALRQPFVMAALMYGAPAILVVGLLVSIWRRSPEAKHAHVG
ncbi:MAG: signal peptidase I [Actinomycetota bacterium]|nr:signal peptidase I [Actinomycetota bacterium]